MSSTNLPRDLMEEILKRLPIKPLLRFRCVSKSWRDLLDSSDFTRFHISRNPKSNYYILFGFQGSYLELVELDLINWSNWGLDSVYCERVPVQYLKLPFSSSADVKILGCCDGLIASGTFDLEEIILVNPSTREYQLLPPIGKKIGPCYNGLGYDSFGDEYKLVVIQSQKDPEKGSEVNIWGSKSTGWRQIHFSSNYTSDRLIDNCGKYSHGALHWILKHPQITSNDRITRFQIAAFDLVTEEFMMQEYDGKQFGCPFGVNLEVLGGCISLCCEVDDDGMDIWMMKEYGVKESWSKFMSYDVWIKPLALSVCGKGLLYRTYDYSDCGCNQNCLCKLFWYNLDTKSKERSFRHIFYLSHSCPPSLLRLPGKLSQVT